MYGIAWQTDEPTGVDFAISARVLNLSERNLVLVCNNQVRICRANRDVRSFRQDTRTFNNETRIECILQFSIFGTVECVTSALIPGQDREALLLAFEEAKLSIVQYDPAIHDFRTISLHSFEDEILRGGLTSNFPLPKLVADPENRCCAMLVYGTHLAVVPFLHQTSSGLNIPSEITPIEPQTPITPSTAGPSRSSTYLRLESYTFPLESVEERLSNVADICFLHGYYEPTLLVLYEPTPTTSARIALRSDTFCIAALSMNCREKAHAVIWNIQSLPYDCYRAIPVRKPVGGVIILGTNDMIYLNQAYPPYGVLVNSNLREATSFPLRSQEDKQMLLDSCSIDFIDNKTLVLCLRSGDLFVVTLLVDNSNVLKSINIDRAAASVITSCVCKCGEGLIFLGSRLGNALLLRYWERHQLSLRVEAPPEQLAFQAPPTKKTRAGAEDVDIYGADMVVAVHHEEIMQVAQYGFEVCDSLCNIAPARQMAVGDPSYLAADARARNGADPIVDMVLACGHAKNGAIAALQRTVRPHVITSSAIPGARSLWTVNQVPLHLSDEELGEGLIQCAQRYLLITKEMDTMVLELRSEITELEQSGFEMGQRTITVGDMLSGEFIVQVTPMAFVLLRGSKRVQHLQIDSSYPISFASIVDPYCLALTENGEIILAQLQPSTEADDDVTNSDYCLRIRPLNLPQDVPATALCVYKDASGLFSSLVPEHLLTSRQQNVKDVKMLDAKPFVGRTDITVGLDLKRSNMTADEEDEMLYGGSSGGAAEEKLKMEDSQNEEEPVIINGGDYTFVTDEATKQTTNSEEEEASIDEKPERPQDAPITFWAFVCREDGVLEIFELPSFQLRFMAKKFSIGHKTVVDADPVKLALDTSEVHRIDDHSVPRVSEMLVVGLGPNKSRPHVFALTEHTLLIYEAFAYSGRDVVIDHLSLRFRKLPHHAELRNHRLLQRSRKAAQQNAEADATTSLQRLNYFEFIGSYSGVFIAGPYPYWMIMTTQGILRTHPMTIDGAVQSFAPFHNVNCHNGFIYLDSDSRMSICQLQPAMNYDVPCPTHKIPLKCTVHLITYLVDAKAYAVATSTRKEVKQLPNVMGEDKQFEELAKDDPNYIYPQRDVFSVQLYSPDTWEPIPDSSITIDDYEHVTVMKEVSLKSEGSVSGMQNYLVLGTIYNYGEDCQSRGRIIVCDIVDVVPEPGAVATRSFKLKQLYGKEQKGPVTSLCTVLGYLLTGMGPKIYIWNFKDNDLVGISFLDMQFYIHTMISIRGLVLVADVFKSISLLRYQEAHNSLSLACRDISDVQVYAVEFLVDQKQLAFLATDSDANIYIYVYHPETRESHGGTRFVRVGGLHVGGRIAALYRVRCHVSDAVIEHKNQASSRHVVHYATLDGALGFVLPLSEKTYRRLLMLQNFLVHHLQHYAGLNPRAHAAGRMGANTERSLLDGNLIKQFRHLTSPEQIEVAKRIGTSNLQLLDDLLEIQRLATQY